MEFDYRSPAKLFIPKRSGGKRHQRISYRRFATAAEAIRFAVEEFPAVRTLDAWMQVGDQRYDSVEICRLYESSGVAHSTELTLAKHLVACLRHSSIDKLTRGRPARTHQ
jgi:hypothetical protein